MATRKQKHAAALEKREKEQAELKRTGLIAQRQEHERQERRRQQIADEAE